MKRKLTVFLTSLFIIVALETSLTLYTDNVVSVFRERTDRLLEYVHAESWDGAAQILNEITTNWDDVRSILEIWISHDEAQDAAEQLSELALLLDVNEKNEALTVIYRLRLAFDHILHKNRVTIANLL